MERMFMWSNARGEDKGKDVWYRLEKSLNTTTKDDVGFSVDWKRGWGVTTVFPFVLVLVIISFLRSVWTEKSKRAPEYITRQEEIRAENAKKVGGSNAYIPKWKEKNPTQAEGSVAQEGRQADRSQGTDKNIWRWLELVSTAEVRGGYGGEVVPRMISKGAYI